ncbi:MAG: AraC family transcriptional regulator [Cyclobacteriaceae bacterium]|nr:AraC family transcriptional regulator [Cyclobacteriaceae bacterium]
MEYQTYPPSDTLAPFIKCYWSLEAPIDDKPERQRIVPDGCMEMIFHCGDLYKQFLPNNEFIIQPRCFVFGQITAPLEIEPTGVSNITAVRFHPTGHAAFVSMASADMENRAVPLFELFGASAVQLEETILAASSHTHRIQLIESFLLERLHLLSANEIAKESVELLFQMKGQISVVELAERLGISKRNLERRFSQEIGLSPKQLAKTIRLQALLKILNQSQSKSLTELALECGYYDQAHFIKDFKEFTGLSPKQFYADNLKMSNLFIGTD